MGNRGLRASNRRPFSEPFRQAQKRKASEVQRVRIWARHTFSGEYDKHAVYPFLSIFILTLVLTTTILAGGPLFHSYIANGHPYCTDYSAHELLLLKGINKPCLTDPSTYLYASPDVGDLSNYNIDPVGNTFYGSITKDGSPAKNIILGGNSTFAGFALNKSPIDLSSLSAKQGWALFGWTTDGVQPTIGLDFGVYFTTNSTAPKTAGYNPISDSNVQLELLFRRASGTTYNMFLLVQRAPNRAIATDNHGCSTTSGSSCWLNVAFTRDPTLHWIAPEFFLNYTSRTTGGSCNGVQGDGCSAIEEGYTTTLAATQALPQYPFSASSLYVGFFAAANLGANIYFNFDVSTVPTACTFCNQMVLYQPTPTATGGPPQLDTGGFFGPIIRALISVAVFMAQNIITFAAFLYGLLATMLVLAASLVGAVLIAVMNTLGGIFSDPTLGSQINTAFSNIVSYLTNVFSGAVAIWSNILTALLNMLNFVVQFLTITVNGGATLFNFIESFFLTMQNFWTVFVGVWNQFMKFYIAGTFTIQYILVGWWIWGMYENFTNISEGIQVGIIDNWLQPSATLLLGMFRAGYYFLDEAYKFVVQLKQLIFGNRIAPGTIAGNG